MSNKFNIGDNVQINCGLDVGGIVTGFRAESEHTTAAVECLVVNGGGMPAQFFAPEELLDLVNSLEDWKASERKAADEVATVLQNAAELAEKVNG